MRGSRLAGTRWSVGIKDRTQNGRRLCTTTRTIFGIRSNHSPHGSIHLRSSWSPPLLLLMRHDARALPSATSGSIVRAYSSHNPHLPPSLVGSWYSLVRKKMDTGSPRELCQVWQDMLEEGIAPDVNLYHSVLSHLRKGNHWEEFFSFFEEMRNRGLVPNGSIYNMAIHASAKLTLVERAFDLARDMEVKGVPKEVFTYGSLLYACSRVRDFKRAISIVAEMLQAGLQPNEHIFTELINSCATREHLDQASKFLEFFSVSPKSTPTFLSPYNCFIGKCLDLGYPDKAMDMYRQCIDAGYVPDERTYFSLIKGCVLCPSAPQFDLAMRLFGEMKGRGIKGPTALYEFLLQQVQEPQRLKGGIAVLEDMLAQGLKPSVGCWGLLVSVACAQNDTESIQYLWNQMQKLQVEPTTHLRRHYDKFFERQAIARPKAVNQPPRSTTS